MNTINEVADMKQLAPFTQLLITLYCLLASPSLLAVDVDSHIDGNNFRLYYKSISQPVPLYKIHTWVLHLYTLDGTPVSDARISIHGGMPAHGHGLPTQPRITADTDGHYFLEGMKFSMTGAWSLWFTIQADGKTDELQVDLQL